MNSYTQNKLFTKLLFTTILTLCITQITSAQFRQEGWVLGGDFRFTSSGNATYFGISPEAGYLYNNGFEIGAGSGYAQISNGNIKNKIWNFGPYINYFITNDFFIRSTYQHMSGKTTQTSQIQNSFTESALWIGGGYQSNSEGVFYRAGLLYNALYKENSSIYNSPILPYASLGYRL